VGLGGDVELFVAVVLERGIVTEDHMVEGARTTVVQVFAGATTQTETEGNGRIHAELEVGGMTAIVLECQRAGFLDEGSAKGNFACCALRLQLVVHVLEAGDDSCRSRCPEV
jgi:hypothetical protein